ncbi:MAG TPA: hypothetical protein VGJ59_15765 [Jatrophihabitantaceae bacterium]|jgi:hypothetical protein
MTDQQVARDRGLTTEEIASAGTTDRDDIGADARPQEPQRPVGGGLVDDTEDAEPRGQLLSGEELQGLIARWRDNQARFVDEPRAAVQDADALVVDIMQRVVRMFAAEHHQLESRWTSADDVSTEDLRQGLLRYRSFFERLLAASGGTTG